MTNAFSLPSLFFGMFLIIPLIFGCLLLFESSTPYRSKTKAQRLGGFLLLIDAAYLIVRTVLIAHHGLHDPELRYIFFITDSTILTIFILVPYAVISEHYPRWWMYLIALTPLALIPIIRYTGVDNLATWSHLVPLLASVIVLILSVKYVRKSDQSLADTFADPDLYTKSWIIHLIIAFIVVTIASMLRYLIHGFTWYNLLVSFMWVALIVAVYVMLIRQKNAKRDTQTLAAEIKTPNLGKKEQPTYYNSETISQSLQKVCVEAKLYLKADLTVEELSRACGTNRTYLATYFKEVRHQNFYEYINSLRLQQVDELMRDPRQSQEVIATKCGFGCARNMRRAYLRIFGRELTR